MNLGRFLGIAISAGLAGLPGAAEATTKRELVRDVIEPYEAAIHERYGRPLTLEFNSASAINAGAHLTAGADGGPYIVVFDGLLALLDVEDLVFVVCHELGHLLGRVAPRPDRVNVEGEADYFGGRCAAEFFAGDEERAIRSARYALAKLNRERTIAEAALCREYDGIDEAYPEHDCRVLSAMHGARGLRRPSCWFNP